MENDEFLNTSDNNNTDQEVRKHDVSHLLDGMYQDWFLDYASYVILERAVPDINDGLKPVQRRILHAMQELEDGRYNKVANIIGHTMKYHPHGDASIGDALIQLGQKNLLIDTQGNWGNIYTGDKAAAPRYIEARLSNFAREVVFQPKVTKWKASYDGRNKEPITLPVKFPLLLAQGVEGIAVGLASKILPHNFLELIDASIAYLKNKDFEILPDFPTGGLADFSRYNDGLRGGRVRIRAKIIKSDQKTITITEIPFGSNTSSLIDSILNANEKGKIKIKKIEDNTAENVEIVIFLSPGVTADQTIEALYAFTDCEISVSPNACVIIKDRPEFLGVSEILKLNTDYIVNLLNIELEVKLQELTESLHYASLEKIFIENRIYIKIEKCTSWEDIIATIAKGLKPFETQFFRPVTRDDIIKLTEIKIKRISRYDSDKADDTIISLKDSIALTKGNIENIIPFSIKYFEVLRKKYGAHRERKTEIRSFDNIEASVVAASNVKLFVSREEGFAGTSLKKDEFICDCSDIDEVIAFRADGKFMVAKISDKTFFGKNIIHIGIFKRNDDRTTYNMIYQDGPKGNIMVKRFAVGGIVRDKEYDLTKGTPSSSVLYFSANPNGEAEKLTVFLRPKPRLKNLKFDFDFSEIAIKGRQSQGNILTRHAVKKINIKDKGKPTFGGIKIWYDTATNKLNQEGNGLYLGDFQKEDKIFSITKSGFFQIHGFDLITFFENDTIFVKKFDADITITLAYFDGAKKSSYLKQFHPELFEKPTPVISEHKNSMVYDISEGTHGTLNFKEKKGRKHIKKSMTIEKLNALRNIKAIGKKISDQELMSLEIITNKKSDKSDNEIIDDNKQLSTSSKNNENPVKQKDIEKDTGFQTQTKLNLE